MSWRILVSAFGIPLAATLTTGCALTPDGRIILGPEPQPKSTAARPATLPPPEARAVEAEPTADDPPPAVAEAEDYVASLQAAKGKRGPTARFDPRRAIGDPNGMPRGRAMDGVGQDASARRAMTEGEAYAAFQSASTPRGETPPAPAGNPQAAQLTEAAPPAAPNAAPTLLQVTAHAPPRAQTLATPTSGESLSINGGERLLVTGPAAQGATTQSNSTTAFQSALDARMMAAIRGDYAAAREPIPLVPKAQQESAAALIEALISIRDRDGGAFDASAALGEIERFRDKLRDIAELQIPNLKICWRVDDYGRYQEIKPPRFATGTAAQFVVYAELRNIAGRAGSDGAWESRFSMTTRVLSMNGQPVIEPLEDHDIVDRCQNRREDFFVARRVTLPATLSPGQYVVLVSATDEIGSKVAEQRAMIEITAGR